MFGKHNTLRNNREVSAGEHTPENSNPWQETMSDMPTFDEHITEAESAESEKAPLNLESLKEVAGFSEQLEKMGANQEILSNPAFKRVLDRVLSESGLKFGANLEELKSGVGDSLRLACQRDKERFLGSSQHDCSNFEISVKKNGDFTIDYAYVDREERTFSRDTFANAKLPPNAENVDAFDDTNIASRLEFVKHQNGDGFNIDIIKVYENQLSPTTDSKNLKAGIHYEAASVSTRTFDVEGIETSRSDIDYESRESQNANYLFTFIKPTDGWEGHAPSKASFNGLEMFMQNRYSSTHKAESVTHYSRNPDGRTAKISGYDRKGKFNSESVPLNTQYGTDDIAVSNGVSIDDLRSTSAE